jgi:hypothetical protein
MRGRRNESDGYRSVAKQKRLIVIGASQRHCIVVMLRHFLGQPPIAKDILTSLPDRGARP